MDMDQALIAKSGMLAYYERELRHLREVAREFARQYPERAELLDFDQFAKDRCVDPYVERLLEGFAYLAARVQMKIDAEFPAFTQHLLEFVYPHYLAPTPSLLVAQFTPENCPATGDRLPRGTVLKSQLADEQTGTRREYRTAHELTLWPLIIEAAEYLPSAAKLPQAVADELAKTDLPAAKAAIRLRLATTGGHRCNELTLDSLPVFLHGKGDLTTLVYEQLLTDAIAMAVCAVRDPAKPGRGGCVLVEQTPQRLGFADEEALLPHGPRSFQGYRLLQEFFALPQRFLFVELAGLGPALRGVEEQKIDIFVLLREERAELERTLDKSLFALFCTPAANLFPMSVTLNLDHTQREHRIHFSPESDYEVYALRKVIGHSGQTQDPGREFLPFYSINGGGPRGRGGAAYYTVRREVGELSARQRGLSEEAPQYPGTDAFIALVDGEHAPYDAAALRRLQVDLLCSNRDLAHSERHGNRSGFDREDERRSFDCFYLEIGAKAQHLIHCVAGPSDPKPSAAGGAAAWRLLSHLSLNYLSLLDSDEGAAALRELLGLYDDPAGPRGFASSKNLRSATARNVVRRIPRHCLRCGRLLDAQAAVCAACASPVDRNADRIQFGRGIEIKLVFDHKTFHTSHAFLLGAVLEQFFARYASLNSFTETVVTTDQIEEKNRRDNEKKELKRWPIRIGRRQTL